MSIYDDGAPGDGGGDIYSGGDELVVPDWDVDKAGPTAPGGKPGKSGGGGGSPVVLCGKKSSMGMVKILSAILCDPHTRYPFWEP